MSRGLGIPDSAVYDRRISFDFIGGHTMNFSALRAANQSASSTRGAAQAIGTQKESINQANTELAATRGSDDAGRAQKSEKNAQADFIAAKNGAQRAVNLTEQGQCANTLTGAANILKSLLG